MNKDWQVDVWEKCERVFGLDPEAEGTVVASTERGLLICTDRGWSIFFTEKDDLLAADLRIHDLAPERRVQWERDLVHLDDAMDGGLLTAFARTLPEAGYVVLKLALANRGFDQCTR